MIAKCINALCLMPSSRLVQSCYRFVFYSADDSRCENFLFPFSYQLNEIKKLLKAWKKLFRINKQSQKHCKWINAFVFLFICLFASPFHFCSDRKTRGKCFTWENIFRQTLCALISEGKFTVHFFMLRC